MLGFDVSRDQFVATATATALLVDAARMPVYIAVERASMFSISALVVVACVGVVAGTLLGRWLLNRVPERRFRQIVGATVLLLGIVTLLRGQA
jgi:uncharacterized membrane protein YfcA